MGGRKARQAQQRKAQGEAAEVATLERLIEEGAPPPGGQAADGDGWAAARRFAELPLSSATQEALRAAGFTELTAIQRFALPHALAGRDVLGAAKTGSGKTLAFLIPLLERLFRLRWGGLDGLGALVISPTRELALQIFNELRRVGARHDCSAGLLIGGKNVREEQERVAGMNILVCTPGRLLQHMDETPGFDASPLQVLVLDEADRILDMGFSATLTAIVANLPRGRQTLLFSATQTKSVKQLALLSLERPEYVAVHEHAEAPTPARLEQAFAMCELPDKLSVLWSFIRSHLKAKTLVFLSTCKQVRFVHEALRHLRPGCPLRCLHGGMKQMRRMATFYDFLEGSGGMVLLATDIAARGLDFSKLDWVLQLDCPEDAAAYIHRVGRTARYVSAGKGLLLLAPSEAAFLQQLAAARVPIRETRVNPRKTQPLQPALQALLSKHQELKEMAQKCVTAYLKSVFLAPNRAVFDLERLPVDEFAHALGLSAAPKLRFVRRGARRPPQEAAPGEAAQAPAASDAAAAAAAAASAAAAAERGSDASGSSDSDGAGGGLLRVVARHAQPQPGGPPAAAAAAGAGPEAAAAAEPGRRKRKRLRIRLDAAPAARTVFGEDGEAVDPLAALAAADGPEEGRAAGHASAAARFAAAAAVLRSRDAADKRDYQERRRSKAALRKAKARAREGEGEGGPAVTLGPGLGFPGQEALAGSGDDGRCSDSGGSERGRGGAAAGGTAAGKRARTEKSHLGMALQEPGDGLHGLGLAEQEALALRLLARR